MKSILLAIETSHATCSVALQKHNQHFLRLAPAVIDGKNQVLQLITEILAEAEVEVPQLTAIAWCHGPGSFTGLRIGAAVVQGLALPHAIPLIPISSLKACAYQAYQQSKALTIGVIINAYGSQAYVGWYQCEKMHLLQAESCLPFEAIQLPDNQPWVVVGNVPLAEIPGLPSSTRCIGTLMPTAQDILHLAKSSFTAMQSPEHIQPHYLNLPEYRRS